MNGKLTEDKSEDTDCDGSSLPEDFSEVGWQEAGRHLSADFAFSDALSIYYFLYWHRTCGNNFTCLLNENILVGSSCKWCTFTF